MILKASDNQEVIAALPVPCLTQAEPEEMVTSIAAVEQYLPHFINRIQQQQKMKQHPNLHCHQLPQQCLQQQQQYLSHFTSKIQQQQKKKQPPYLLSHQMPQQCLQTP
ncbi:double-stranded RNA-binding protein Staufen homolog [Schistocerca serialis cubense]|uniref:double-stranded RNA-binding protein Staufen homolog n=1 Tax=Schistocerca serialis cubense TaxID=2023355 RepID=UPI00214EA8E9|nr:double-stranded RNA-binding protein Staufen homolog [Schistocerca serialis cubense]